MEDVFWMFWIFTEGKEMNGRQGWGGVLDYHLHQGLLNGHEHFHVAVHAGWILEIVTPP